MTDRPVVQVEANTSNGISITISADNMPDYYLVCTSTDNGLKLLIHANGNAVEVRQ